MTSPAKEKIKILICTHSAALHSGLSETTRNIFIPLLQKYKDKYEIHQLGYFHHAAPEQIPWPIYPTKVVSTPHGPRPMDEDRYGQVSFDEIVARVQPDIVFGYGDMWHFEHMLNSPLRNSYRMMCYYTIDGQPYFGQLHADNSTDWGKKLLKADEIAVITHFGKEVLQRGCKELENVDIKVVNHPLDMSRYNVLNEEQKLKVRDRTMPKQMSRNCFIAGFVGKNQFRKQNYKLWEISHYVIYGDYIECLDCKEITIKEWNHTTRTIKDPDKYPGELDKITMYSHDYRYEHCWHCKSKNIKPGVPQPNFYLWTHTDRNEPGYNPDFHERMWKIQNNCITTSGLGPLVGVKSKDLALLMSSWDCMLYPSGGEGNGNPAQEALACGVPVVYSDYSSHSEFCHFGGLPIRCTYQPEMANGIQRAVVDTGHAVKQLISLIRDPKLKNSLGVRGRLHVSQFSIPNLVDVWDQIFVGMMQKPLPINSQSIYSTIV